MRERERGSQSEKTVGNSPEPTPERFHVVGGIGEGGFERSNSQRTTMKYETIDEGARSIKLERKSKGKKP